jgi:hypothetical protein
VTLSIRRTAAFVAPLIFLFVAFYAPQAMIFSPSMMKFAAVGTAIAASAIFIFMFYDNKTLKQSELVIFSILYAFVAVVFCANSLSPDHNIFEQRSKNAFNHERKVVIENPKLFPAIKALASQYDTELVLGKLDDSWALTNLVIPEGSAAYMTVKDGYCEMGFNRTRVLRDFDLAGFHHQDDFMAGIMAHELGHCLDIKRDFAHLAADHKMATASIAPQDRAGVHDLESYLAAENKASTALWREAYADTFAVGYWRLHDNTSSGALIKHLGDVRNLNKTDDRVHATMCWIQAAEKAQPPKSDTDLAKWADTIRSTAECKIP